MDDATDTTVSLSWMMPDSSDGDIIHYRVEYRPKLPCSKRTKSLSNTVTGLLPNTKYEFRVAAVTAKGCGPYSDTVCLSTISKFTSFLNRSHFGLIIA